MQSKLLIIIAYQILTKVEKNATKFVKEAEMTCQPVVETVKTVQLDNKNLRQNTMQYL